MEKSAYYIKKKKSGYSETTSFKESPYFWGFLTGLWVFFFIYQLGFLLGTNEQSIFNSIVTILMAWFLFYSGLIAFKSLKRLITRFVE